VEGLKRKEEGNRRSQEEIQEQSPRDQHLRLPFEGTTLTGDISFPANESQRIPVNSRRQFMFCY